jgi:hypothetical protein
VLLHHDTPEDGRVQMKNDKKRKLVKELVTKNVTNPTMCCYID